MSLFYWIERNNWIMQNKIRFCVFKKNISKYYLIKISWKTECKGLWQFKYLICFFASLKVLLGVFFDYSSSLLSAHLSNLSGVKMFKHMLTVKHLSIITHPNQLLKVFCGALLAGAWSPCQEHRSKLWFWFIFVTFSVFSSLQATLEAPALSLNWRSFWGSPQDSK